MLRKAVIGSAFSSILRQTSNGLDAVFPFRAPLVYPILGDCAVASSPLDRPEGGAPPLDVLSPVDLNQSHEVPSVKQLDSGGSPFQLDEGISCFISRGKGKRSASFFFSEPIDKSCWLHLKR